MQVWELSTVLLVVGLLLLIVAVVVFVELKQYKVSSSFLLCGTAMTLWAVLLMTTTNLQDVDLDTFVDAHTPLGFECLSLGYLYPSFLWVHSLHPSRYHSPQFLP